MAITGVDRGTGTNTAATTFTTFTTATNFTAGSLAVLCISADNSGNNLNNISSVTDALGNTWTNRSSAIYDPGAANAGIQGSIFTTNMDKGVLTTSNNITTTFGANTTSDTWTLMEITPTAGYRIRFVNTANLAGQAVTGGTAVTFTTSSITQNNLLVCALYVEGGTTQSGTGDSDTTNGSWSTMQYAEIGSTTSGNVILTQRKVVSASATQTWNPTMSLTADLVASWIQLTEEPLVIRDPIGCGDGMVVGPRTLRP
jgi:hypothetical protein